MSDEPRPRDDEQPAPLEHADAERASDAEAGPERQAEEIENDPARNPGAGPLRDTKGG